jgi:hypothetical protein
MHSKMIALKRLAALERILEGLAPELIESTDEELLQAAKDLGMDPSMRGSAAFSGVKYSATPHQADYFDIFAIQVNRPALLTSPDKRPATRRKRPKPPGGGDESH